MSSLAAQLQGIASLDASRLTSRTGAPTSKSYLFPPKVAADHDLDTIYALGLSGYEELLALDPSFEEFEDDLFSEQAKRTDRMILNAEENQKLDAVLERCLWRLSRWIGVMAGGRCIEWLVRRFRVHEMNAEIVLQVFYPYHSTPNFARMLAILSIPNQSAYHAPFNPLGKDAQAVPRSYIAAAISPEKDRSLRLLEDVLSLLKRAHKEGALYRGLMTFWSGTLVDLLDRYQAGKKVLEGLVKLLVESFVDILTMKNGGPDLNASIYPPLILLTRTVRLADEVFLVLLDAIMTPNTGADPTQRVFTLLFVLEDRGAWTLELGEQGVEKLGRVKQLGEILLGARQRYGFDNALATILRIMSSNDSFAPHLDKLIDNMELSAPLVEVVATGLAKHSSAESEDLLGKLREKYPAIVDRVVTVQQGENHRQEMSTVPKTEIFGADVAARIRGVNELFANQNQQDSDTVREIILTRLRYDEPEVLSTIYKHTDGLSSILKDDSSYLDAVAPAFSGHRTDARVARVHLAFACNQYCSSNDTRIDVFKRLIFPALLVQSEPALLDEDCWSVIQNSSWGKLSLARACHGFSQSVTPETLQSAAQELSGAIIKSETHRDLIDFVFTQLSSSHTPSKLLAHLILICLIITTSESELGHRTLSYLSRLQTDIKYQDIGESTDPMSPLLLRAVCERPRDKTTATRLQLALYAALSTIKRVETNDISIVNPQFQGISCQTFATSLYALSNSDILPVQLSQAILRSVLTQLRDDALIFLASVWTAGPRHARVAALRHALSYLNAQSSSGREKLDFQLIIPALLVAMQDKSKDVRTAAVGLLEKVSGVVEDGGSETYALNSIYGARSEKVQLLRQSDLKVYLESLTAQSAEIILDPGHLKVVHAKHLGGHHGSTRKNSTHRRAVISALASHIQAWSSINARLALLSSLEDIPDTTVFEEILPLLSSSQELEWVSGLALESRARYLGLLFKTLTRMTMSQLTEESAGWICLRDLLTQHGDLAPVLRSLLFKRLQIGVFEGLRSHLKVLFVTALLDSLHDEHKHDSVETVEALRTLKMDSPLLQELLQNLCQAMETSHNRKRQKQETKSHADKSEQSLDDLTVLIDSRDWNAIPGPAAPLVATLMNVLSSLLAKRQGVKKGIDYLEQEILGAILSLLEALTDAEELNKAHVGIEVIIKVIRASNNPRTSQRSLLVISELARFIPESVLHNVMPIFTFMGASDFQRDDAYSFSVVEKTISKIIPVLISSLKTKDLDRLELYKEALPIMSIFTDMAGRLPRHRTLPFFIHLVKSLDTGYFLPAIAILLVDRATTKSGRGGQSSALALELPISVTTSFSIEDQLLALQEVVKETRRLCHAPDTALVSQNNQDNLADRTTKQINAMLSFTLTLLSRLAGKSCDQTVVQEIVSSLVELAGLDRDGVTHIEPVLAAAMQLLSADNFFKVVLAAIASNDNQYSEMGLKVFNERLPLVKTEVRSRNASVLGDIVKAASERLSDPVTVSSALAAIQAVVVSAKDNSEDVYFAQVVPSLLKIISNLQGRHLTVASLNLLDALVKQLGSRIIPSIQGIVDLGLKLLQSSSDTMMRETTGVLGTLLSTVPTFISSKQMHSVLATCLEHYNRDPTTMAGLMSVTAKKVPTKSLFPIMMEMWKSVKESQLIPFFEVLRLALKNADRPGLATLTKKTFALFLEVFDLPWKLESKAFDQDVIDTIEASAISSFLEFVTKLNEATFRPLFTRLFDWSVIDLEGQDEQHLIRRKVVLFKVMLGLLQRFKNLLSPYIGILLPHVQELLASFASGDLTDVRLWQLVLETMGKSFAVDDGAYWSDGSVLKIIPSLVPQLGAGTRLAIQSQADRSVSQCLASLAESTTSETVLKALNTAICLQTRDDDAQVRMAALHALDGIWEVQGEELVAFVAETVGDYLSELLEDENSDVVAMARRVLGRIEKASGADVEEYLE
ncbi:hypothetical protein BD324DRAFT_650190 [Kockovaella imperatae]|uniref:U3 small nucleolar RNA-associated protein 10 n=1 Tax=Kockovaella imperatae TaxID=4999 RepID=A0A1Y1UJF1_9TREE|nr:hypothetical protein BD324DRAFT_650190 [Kockovaella imperatae]ORX37624.1 hypothetical protein BD324DRAFT_650190 [Kockovaella imperatae]